VKTNAANKASVDDESGCSMQSYSNPSGHIEDDWTEVSLIRPSNHDNDDYEKSSTCRLKYTVQGGCPRCTMVDYDPATGSKGKTLRALAKYRRHNGRIVFGIFLNLVFPSKSMTRRSDDEDETQDRWISEGDIMECS
jgi:molybdenum cofactor sulfurtransferase